MKFLADFPALCVSRAFMSPNFPSTLQKPKIFKANEEKDPSVVGRFRSWAVCMLAPRAGPPNPLWSSCLWLFSNESAQH